MGQYFTFWKHISYPGRVRRTWISEPTGSLLEKCKEAGMKVEKRRSYYGDSPCIGDPITGVFFHHIRAHNNNNLHLPMSSIFIFIIHNVDHIYPAKGNSWRRGWDQGWPCSPCGGHLERLLKHELKKNRGFTISNPPSCRNVASCKTLVPRQNLLILLNLTRDAMPSFWSLAITICSLSAFGQTGRQTLSARQLEVGADSWFPKVCSTRRTLTHHL